MDEAYDIILKIAADGQRRFSMRLTQEAIMELERNPYVIRSGPDRITYSREFKHHFMREYLSGKKPTEIFREAGFDPRMIGSKRIEPVHAGGKSMQKARWYWRNLSSKKRTHNIGNKKLSQGQFNCVLRPLSSAFAFNR